MSLKLTPTASSESYKALIASIPKDGLWLTSYADIVIPLDFYGAEFTLEVDTLGETVTFEIRRGSNGGLLELDPPQIVRVIPTAEVSQVRLPLTSGINLVHVTSNVGELFLRIGVANFVVPIFLFARQFDDHILRRLIERENAILSFTGSVLLERWFKDVDLLPQSNSLHRLSMRLLADGFSDAGTEISVEKVGTAITGNTPIFKRLFNEMNSFDTLHPLYMPQEHFAGSDAHVWLLDVCLGSFVAAGFYVQNFPNMWVPVDYRETHIIYQREDDQGGEDKNHLLVNTEGDAGCSVEEFLLTQGCFDRMRPWVRSEIQTQFVICLATYPLDTGILVCRALGAVYFDCENLTFEETITDPDVITEEDPTGDG
jgi:hypothetical protein